MQNVQKSTSSAVKAEIQEIKKHQEQNQTTSSTSEDSQGQDSFGHGFFVQPTIQLSRFVIFPTNPGLNLSLGWKYRGTQAGVQIGAQAEIAGFTHVGGGPKLGISIESSGINRFSAAHISAGLLIASGIVEAITEPGELYVIPNFNLAFLFRPKNDSTLQNQQFLLGPFFGVNVFIQPNGDSTYFQYQLGLSLHLAIFK